jgi:hypothetical protein
LSAAPAFAQPGFELVETSARAGDLVHFSISGVEGPVSYELEIDDEEVVEGSGAGSVAGVFSAPDLGDAARTVKVEAEIRASGKRKKVKRKLEYLGAALPVASPPAASSAPPTPVAPVAVPEAAPSPTNAASAPSALVGPVPAAATKPRTNHRAPRQSDRRRAARHRRQVKETGKSHRRSRRGGGRRDREGATGKTRSKRPLPLTAPLFDGVPEPGAGELSGGVGALAATALAPPSAAERAKRTVLGEDGGLNVAFALPALLGAAAIVLAGSAAIRRRRLASPSRRP